MEEAIDWVTKLAEFKPLWIEEPTSPDDILGHAKIAKVRDIVSINRVAIDQKAMLIYWLDSYMGTSGF